MKNSKNYKLWIALLPALLFLAYAVYLFVFAKVQPPSDIQGKLNGYTREELYVTNEQLEKFAKEEHQVNFADLMDMDLYGKKGEIKLLENVKKEQLVQAIRTRTNYMTFFFPNKENEEQKLFVEESESLKPTEQFAQEILHPIMYELIDEWNESNPNDKINIKEEQSK